MGFGWTCQDETGKDLFKEFDPDRSFYRAMDLGPDPSDNSKAPYSRSDIQLCAHTDDCGGLRGEFAKDRFRDIQSMVFDNKIFILDHEESDWYDMDRIYAFLSIPIERVWFFIAGY